MKRIVIILCLMAAGTAAWAQSKIVTDSIQSTKLGCEQKYNVYLPSGYDAAKSYPVIYLLHGLYGDYSNWAGTGRMKDVADELIACGELVPTVIIMPNAGDNDVHNYQNGYFNVKDWPYEDFFFEEFLPAAEKKYNCGGCKGRRAIMGLSMGGGGSIVYAQHHPDLFSSAYGMSAWLDNKHREVRGANRPGSKLVITDESVREHSALDFIDQADDATKAQLRTVKWFLDCGDDDILMLLSVQLHLKMNEAGIKNELRVRNGGHTWEYWHTALRLSLPFASRNFCQSTITNKAEG
ncbi:MAG: esterase family protein [Bacteroidales bacterium]|jgi:enterochelin esterase-like enzyme|nr:esterase family protein [Bacteroidales bacterium]